MSNQQYDNSQTKEDNCKNKILNINQTKSY